MFRFFDLAAVAKLADAQDLGSCGETHGGSSPSRRRVKKSRDESQPDAQDLGSCPVRGGGSSPKSAAKSVETIYLSAFGRVSTSSLAESPEAKAIKAERNVESIGFRPLAAKFC